MSRFITTEELRRYPKEVLLAAIERLLLMPTRYDLEYCAWAIATQRGIAKMKQANELNQKLGPINPMMTSLEQHRHIKAHNANSALFDESQREIDEANKRFERFKAEEAKREKES